jgi:hypothetical protein
MWRVVTREGEGNWKIWHKKNAGTKSKHLRKLPVKQY